MTTGRINQVTHLHPSRISLYTSNVKCEVERDEARIKERYSVNTN